MSAATSLPASTKIIYGVGEIANAVKTVLFGLFVLFFYVTVLGLPGTWVGAATAIAIASEAVLEPWMGRLSDRGHWRLGRRHAPMLVGALTIGPTFWLLFSPPTGLSSVGLFVWLVVLGVTVRVATAAFVVPYYALGAELSHDYDERTSITATRGGLALIGTLLAAGVSLSVFFPTDASGVDAKLHAHSYSLMGAVFGMLISVAALAATLGTLNRRRTPMFSRTATFVGAGFLNDLATAWTSRPFRALTLSYAVVFLSTVLNSVVAIHFLSFYGQINDGRALALVQGAFFAGAIVGVPAWVWLGRTFEKRDLYMVATLATAALLVAAWLLIGSGRPLGTGNALPFVIGEGMAGVLGSVFWILPYSMLADVIDADELTARGRREGLFIGLFRVGVQVASSASVIATGVLVDWFAGVVPGEVQQTAETTARIGLVATLLPAALLVIGALMVRSYKLERTLVMSIQAELSERRVSGPERQEHYSNTPALEPAGATLRVAES